MRRWIVRIAIVLAIVAVGLALRATVLAPKPIDVRVTEASRGQVEETVTNSRAGTVKARRRAQLSPQVGGRVIEIRHREGERVEAGEVLLRLDPDVLQGRIALARRELQTSEAQRQRECVAAERSRREAGRLRKLAGEGIVSTDVLDQAQSAAEAAVAGCQAGRAGVEQSRAAIDLATRELDQTVLRAPFSGVIADLTVEVGEWTTPSPPAMMVPAVIDIIDSGSLYVSAPMDEVDSARIQPGQPARVTIDSYPGRQFQGHVSRIAPFVLDREEQNRTVDVEVELDVLPGSVRLLPGTSADAEVILNVRGNVLRIPTPALIEGGKVLVAADGKLVERQLKVGLRNWDWTEVLGGLSPGDEIVVSLDRPEILAGAEVTTTREPAPESGKSP